MNFNLPRSTFVIESPRRGVRIARKHIDDWRNLKKLRDSRTFVELELLAAAFLSISDDRHDDDDEFCECLRFFLMQAQLLSIVYRYISLIKWFKIKYIHFLSPSAPTSSALGHLLPICVRRNILLLSFLNFFLLNLTLNCDMEIIFCIISFRCGTQMDLCLVSHNDKRFSVVLG